MKTQTLFFQFLCAILLMSTFAKAQVSVTAEYIYDENGNRMKREVITLTQKSSNVSYQIDSNSTVEVTNSVAQQENSLSTDKQNEIPVSIFPNPTYGLITVKIIEAEDNSKLTLITLFSENGTFLSMYYMVGNETQLDLSAYSPGVYYLKFHLGDAEKSYKVIKQQ